MSGLGARALMKMQEEVQPVSVPVIVPRKCWGIVDPELEFDSKISFS